MATITYELGKPKLDKSRKVSIVVSHKGQRRRIPTNIVLTDSDVSRSGKISSRKIQKAIDDKVKKQVAEQQAQLKAFCEQARTNLAQLQNNPRLREEVEGDVRRLDDTQRQERIVEAKKQIKENCS